MVRLDQATVTEARAVAAGPSPSSAIDEFATGRRPNEDAHEHAGSGDLSTPPFVRAPRLTPLWSK
jgi:hypothetical protein